MPIDPRQFAVTPEGRQAERFADLERQQRQLAGASLNRGTVFAVAANSVSQSVISSSGPNLIMGQTYIDNGGLWSAAQPDRLTAPLNGIYIAQASVQMDANATGDRQLTPFIFGGAIGAFGTVSARAPANAWRASTSIPVVLETGDQFIASVFQDSGSTLNVTAATLSLMFIGAI